MPNQQEKAVDEAFRLERTGFITEKTRVSLTGRLLYGTDDQAQAAKMELEHLLRAIALRRRAQSSSGYTSALNLLTKDEVELFTCEIDRFTCGKLVDRLHGVAGAVLKHERSLEGSRTNAWGYSWPINRSWDRPDFTVRTPEADPVLLDMVRTAPRKGKRRKGGRKPKQQASFNPNF